MQCCASTEPSSWAHPCSKSPCPKTFLFSQPPGSHPTLLQQRSAPLSKQRQAATKKTWLQTTTLRLPTTTPRPHSRLAPRPPGRGQHTLTVGQEVHPLAQALEVRVPQGCLRRNPALGFVLQKDPEKGGYVHTARAKWQLVGCAAHRVCVHRGACMRCAHACASCAPKQFHELPG